MEKSGSQPVSYAEWNHARQPRHAKGIITWKVKVASNNSFPGDHATSLLFIGAFIIRRLRSWYGVATALGIVIFSLSLSSVHVGVGAGMGAGAFVQAGYFHL